MMNYAEEITYWYLRLNGFFPISNFVIHRSSNVRHTSDCDLLAIRMPHVYEEVGGQPEDWDQELADEVRFDRTIGIICEVKSGRYDASDLFRDEHLTYAVGRLGLVPVEEIHDVAVYLTGAARVELGSGACIIKLLVANKRGDGDTFVFRPLSFVEDFLVGRVRRYPEEKYADRMYFSSELFQYTIHKVYREREQRQTANI